MAQLQRIAIAPAQIEENLITLTKEQQHYLGRVLRLRAGDRFIAMDGQGKWWLAQLESEQAQILETLTVETELAIAITLMVALPKGNGFDEIVRYCTELGVTCIAPVLSERTLLNPSPQKLERWRRIATEAAEQSERAFVPTILEPIAFSAAMTASQATHRYICEARGDYPHLNNVVKNDSREIVIATGPEGGWTETEIENAIASGYQPVSLGRRILRAVTAPVVALTLISAIYEV
ncbi:16S rRNA (uracil(1498)-N(3))-methyltransferase [Nodularia sphaerocarpa]|uniref:16S rRNA (uracil(1498)-N(3))-methyltransferase n=1 Tax=Nodularia sphaerocarpa TaxID=137816 RepID=UPI001EFAB66F|nr:16S rRNA (uracil(1498)-N(3))-methyltransferase [Nodularia sphaerocarpa]MDB9374402.1 16S rRNA (uracil(1498)-N(3))-methyltransferase [Nodularia sphaerocarpa CS-585]MDB9376560.1 16S rRNA (uracil(1498)-N(3))-methyltransferase [Nodularia sphaerocarpa CS-585A2]ULP72358.1 Ribosomal RNA small subunit methyltransferase E [Nodularia sphaerocarpa UHCC 0038]